MTQLVFLSEVLKLLQLSVGLVSVLPDAGLIVEGPQLRSAVVLAVSVVGFVVLLKPVVQLTAVVAPGLASDLVELTPALGMLQAPAVSAE